MSAEQAAGLLLILGPIVFGLGASIGVPRVFTERDPQVRLDMLTEHIGVWRLSQPLYGLGGLIAAVGVGCLAVDARDAGVRLVFAAACVMLVAGVLAWTYSLYSRAVRVADFAFGRLPGWSFATYVLLTIIGLALLSVGLLTGGFPVWLGWVALAADVFFLAVYLRFKDLPPFAFYLLLLLVGVVVVL